MKAFLSVAEKWFLRLYLAALKVVVYSGSSFLTMTLLSLYGFIVGVAAVPRKRVSAVKSLLHYGVDVLQHGMSESIRDVNS